MQSHLFKSYMSFNEKLRSMNFYVAYNTLTQRIEELENMVEKKAQNDEERLILLQQRAERDRDQIAKIENHKLFIRRNKDPEVRRKALQKAIINSK